MRSEIDPEGDKTVISHTERDGSECGGEREEKEVGPLRGRQSVHYIQTTTNKIIRKMLNKQSVSLTFNTATLGAECLCVVSIYIYA